MIGHSGIAVSNESNVRPYDGWDAHHTIQFSQFLLDELHLPSGTELSIAFINPEPMARLHEQWLDLAGPTDVMSFPMDELREGATEPGHLGDVVICPQVAQEQAVSAGHSARQEIELLLTHGVLHLLGHDHAEPSEHEVMFTRQQQLLDAWWSSRSRSEDFAELCDPSTRLESCDEVKLPSSMDDATPSSRRLS